LLELGERIDLLLEIGADELYSLGGLAEQNNLAVRGEARYSCLR